MFLFYIQPQPEDYGDQQGPADLPSGVAPAPHHAVGGAMPPPQGNIILPARI